MLCRQTQSNKVPVVLGPVLVVLEMMVVLVEVMDGLVHLPNIQTDFFHLMVDFMIQ